MGTLIDDWHTIHIVYGGDNRFVSVRCDANCYMWNFETGECLEEFADIFMSEFLLIEDKHFPEMVYESSLFIYDKNDLNKCQETKPCKWFRIPYLDSSHGHWVYLGDRRFAVNMYDEVIIIEIYCNKFQLYTLYPPYPTRIYDRLYKQNHHLNQIKTNADQICRFLESSIPDNYLNHFYH